MALLRVLLAALLTSSWAYAQTITDVLIEGLPPEVAGEKILGQLAEKKGAAYDKTKEPGDRADITALLQDLGYLDADVKSSDNFVPGGIRLTYVVKVRAIYRIEAVKAVGLSKEAIQGILDELKITKDTACTREIGEQLTQAIALKLGINYLFVSVERKLNANKKDVTLIFSK